MLAEVAIIVVDETTPAARSWFGWRDALHVIDVACCCAVLFPIVWSIRHLRDASQVRVRVCVRARARVCVWVERT